MCKWIREEICYMPGIWSDAAAYLAFGSELRPAWHPDRHCGLPGIRNRSCGLPGIRNRRCGLPGIWTGVAACLASGTGTAVYAKSA